MRAKVRKKRFFWFTTFAVVVFMLGVNVFAQATPEHGTDRILDNPSGVVLDTSRNPTTRRVPKDKTYDKNLVYAFFMLLGTFLGPIIHRLPGRLLAVIKSIIRWYKDLEVFKALFKQKDRLDDEALKNIRSENNKIKDKTTKNEIEIEKLKVLVKQFEKRLDSHPAEGSLKTLAEERENLMRLVEKSLETLAEEREKLMRLVENLKLYIKQEVERLTKNIEEKLPENNSKGRQKPKRVKKDSKGKEKKDDKS